MIDINRLIMDSMKSRNKVESDTYKLLKAKILEFKTSKEQREYTEAEEINIIKKMIEERKSTAEIYKQNNRPELANDELAQAEVLEALMPEMPTEKDVVAYLEKNYPQGVEKKAMGFVINLVKENLLGVDGKLVADCVKKILI